MKLCAIYNVWFDSLELLPYSLNSIKDHVDHVIIIWQSESNYGEVRDTWYELSNITDDYPDDFITTMEFKPSVGYGGTVNETNKRQYGLQIAKAMQCTHFTLMDCDELWADFPAAKAQYLASDKEGSVAEMYTYFKRPTWRLAGPDNYYVPFIHRLKPYTVSGARNYSYHCDPTRSVNCDNVALISEKMHHFSWVRKDPKMKARNSSARANIAASKLLSDYNNPELGPGYYVTDYQQKLIEVPNLFNIPWTL